METHGTYIGEDPRLKDKTAIIQDNGCVRFIRAQFDDATVLEAHGWHLYSREDFRIDAGRARSPIDDPWLTASDPYERTSISWPGADNMPRLVGKAPELAAGYGSKHYRKD